MKDPVRKELDISQGPDYAQVRVRVSDELGLHARPAARLAQAAQRFKAEVTLISDQGRANAKSILEILTLAASMGAELTLHCQGPDAGEAARSLSALFYTENP